MRTASRWQKSRPPMRAPGRSQILAVALLVAASLPAASGAQQPPPRENPRVREIVAAVSAPSIGATLQKLVSFGTRHTASDTVSAARGIGAARRWVKGEFDRISAACGSCFEVFYVSEKYPWGDSTRTADSVSVVSVVAIKRGSRDPNRVVLMTAHLDSRVNDIREVRDSAPGANDDGSGVAGVLEAARVLSRRTFDGSIAFAALAGEEEGLWGGRTLARTAKSKGWYVEGVLNNDMIGNIEGVDGAIDNGTVRVFSEGVPPTETDVERMARRGTGGEVDGISRQLARYLEWIAGVYLSNLRVLLVYRLDRFGRGGDHRAFADLGFAAVRVTDVHENFTRQHQRVRVENGVAYGDVLEGVNVSYVAKVTALNAAALASLAWAPAPPRSVRITGAVSPAATLSWVAPQDSAAVLGYQVYWRATDASRWESSRWVGQARAHTFDGLVIDNFFFGVSSVSAGGDESPVVFPAGGTGAN